MLSLQGMKVFFLIVAIVYILYLVFLVVRACSELKNMPYSGLWENDVSHIWFKPLPSPITQICCVFDLTRSPAQVFNSADICGPYFKVRFKEKP